MRFRDIFIVCVAIAFCMFGWYQEDGLAVWSGIRIHIPDSEAQRYVIPKPVVVDMKGDGHPVILTSTSYGILEMFRTHFTIGNAESSFVPIEPSALKIFSSRITGIAAGKLEKNGEYSIFVTTGDFRLYRLSSDNFSEIWNVPFHDVLSSSYHTSISVLTERIYEGDEGRLLRRRCRANETRLT
uniref:Uncharacterized protein TCIL3000_11_16040 n=1 Tax=Trypanosoma congolense (strain IL3000) TaxID=1068625 RepID=G0V371_TRYCI|nr:unnamed protein product [Trypanosoma congolense IL3000]